MMGKITSYFFKGLLILLPVVLTIYLIFLIFTALNETIFSAAGSFLSYLIPSLQPGLLATLLGVIITLALIVAAGMITSHYLGNYLLSQLERWLQKIPVVKLLYNTLKDLFQAFMGEQKSFDQPVLVQVSKESPIQLMGFITQNDLRQLGLNDQVAVYLPQSYNFAGNLILVPKELITEIDLPAGDATTFVVSGGITLNRSDPTPEEKD